MNKLSKTSKLDNIMSWSLQALETCQGSVDEKGELVPACSGCYATQGTYNFPGTKLPSASTEPEQVSSACNDQLMILSSLLVLDNLFILVPYLSKL